MAKRDPHRRSSQSASPAGSGLPTWTVLVLIALLTLVAYSPAMKGELLWDDDAHVTRPELQSVTGLVRIWFDIGRAPATTQQYYPLLFSWFWVQHRLWGDDMLGYHIVNVFLHLGAAFLAYVILRRLKIPGALLAAAIFAVHPVHAESVAWITEQKNTLSAVFYLGAILVYLQFDETRAWSSYLLALALFACALLSKTVTVTLPPALLFILWWQRGRLSWQRDVLPLVPFFLLAAADGAFTVWFERKIIGAEGREFELTLLEKPLLAGRAFWFYLEKLLWPVDLIFIYPRWNLDPSQAWQWLFPAAALALLGLCWALRARWRGPLAGLLFFVGTLFPVLGFLNVFFFEYSFVTDHFQYLASLGVIVLVAAGIALAIERLPTSRQAWGTAGCALLVGMLATLTWQQSHLYGRDVIHLFETTIDKNPGAWMAYNNVGIAYFDKGQFEKAIERYEQVLQIKPDYDKAQNNWGNALRSLGRTQEAIDHYRLALQLNPDQMLAHYNLGVKLLNVGQTQEAFEHLTRSLELNPNSPEAHNSISKALALLGRPAEAMDHLREALRLNPDHALAEFNLGSLLIQVGQPQEASEHLAHAVQLQPDDADAWANLGLAQAQLMNAPQAIAATQKGLMLARSRGQTALAQKIEAQLSFLLSGQAPTAPPSHSAPTETPQRE